MRAHALAIFIILLSYGASAIRVQRLAEAFGVPPNSKTQASNQLGKTTSSTIIGDIDSQVLTAAPQTSTQAEVATPNVAELTTEVETATETVVGELLTTEIATETTEASSDGLTSLSAGFVEEASELSGSIVTSSLYEGESVVTFLPSPVTYASGAPFYAFTDAEGETFVAQILESYESNEGENLVTFNLGGEATTITATLGSVPYSLVVDSTGEVYVAEVVETCAAEKTETTTLEESQVTPGLQVPDVIAETEVPTEVELTTTTVEGEATVVLVPSTGDIIPNAPFVPISNGESTVIAQVLESYESSTGEQLVTINAGGGESITFEGEIVETEYPLAPVVTDSGEVEVVEVVEVTTNLIGETVVTIPSENGETTEIYAEPIVDPSVETPDQIICLPPGHAAEESSETFPKTTTPTYQAPSICRAPATSTTGSTSPTSTIPTTVPTLPTETTATTVTTVPVPTATPTPTPTPTPAPTPTPTPTPTPNEEENCEAPKTIDYANLNLKIPEIITKTEVPTDIDLTAATVEGEITVVLLPSTGDIIPDAPFEPISDKESGSAYVAQVLESYESSAGEELVTINLGGGESLTVGGEILETEYPLVPVVTSSGEVEVVEVIEISVSETGDTVLTVPGNCNTTTELIAEPIVEPTIEPPDQIICLPPGHAEEESAEEESAESFSGSAESFSESAESLPKPSDYQPPSTCEAPAASTTSPAASTTSPSVSLSNEQQTNSQETTESTSTVGLVSQQSQTIQV